MTLLNSRYLPTVVAASKRVSLLSVSGLFAATVIAVAAQSPQTQADPAGIELYEKKIRPLFISQCYGCHGAKQQLSGLRLDTAAGFKKGGNRGALLSTESEKSLLLKAVSYTDISLRMPPRAKLKDEEIAAVAEWVKMGAPMPADQRQPAVGQGPSTASIKSTKSTADWKQREAHWAYQPLRPFGLRELLPLSR
jgi:mono/diheme cytochrome c family protein